VLFIKKNGLAGFRVAHREGVSAVKKDPELHHVAQDRLRAQSWKNLNFEYYFAAFALFAVKSELSFLLNVLNDWNVLNG
jgi:hypothetical protein